MALLPRCFTSDFVGAGVPTVADACFSSFCRELGCSLLSPSLDGARCDFPGFFITSCAKVLVDGGFEKAVAPVWVVGGVVVFSTEAFLLVPVRGAVLTAAARGLSLIRVFLVVLLRGVARIVFNAA